MNDRPLQHAPTEEARRIIRGVYDYYDVAGAFCLVNSQEWAALHRSMIESN